jgi:hypothetical protein
MTEPEHDLGQAVMNKLGINRDELNSLYTACPVNGAVGTQVAMAIIQRFELTGDEDDWVTTLYERGILTEAEWNWMRDG